MGRSPRVWAGGCVWVSMVAGLSYLSEISSPLVGAGVIGVQVRNFKIGMVLVERALMFTGRFCTSNIFLLRPIGFITIQDKLTDLQATPCLTMG